MAEIVQLKEQAGELSLTRSGAVLRIAMNRPPANALSLRFMSELLAALRGAAEDSSVLVVILASNQKVFCAGHDLKEMQRARDGEDAGRLVYEQTLGRCAELMLAITHHRCPVIAEVNGIATAAGCQLVASCDLAIAGEEARFATPGVNIGLFCSTPMVALTRNVHPKHAMEMLLTGETIEPAHAREIGLINRVVPKEYLAHVTLRYGEAIASKSPAALKIGKEAFYRQAEMSLEEAYAYAGEVMVENMLERDADEGIGAFLDKRAPQWQRGDS